MKDYTARAKTILGALQVRRSSSSEVTTMPMPMTTTTSKKSQQQQRNRVSALSSASLLSSGPLDPSESLARLLATPAPPSAGLRSRSTTTSSSSTSFSLSSTTSGNSTFSTISSTPSTSSSGTMVYSPLTFGSGVVCGITSSTPGVSSPLATLSLQNQSKHSPSSEMFVDSPGSHAGKPLDYNHPLQQHQQQQQQERHIAKGVRETCGPMMEMDEEDQMYHRLVAPLLDAVETADTLMLLRARL